MTRPSTHTDKLLIKAARGMFPTTGCSRLNVREVAKKAGVNLGMFHYHFKTKRVFVRHVLQEFYEDFLSNFDLEAIEGKSPFEKLRSVLIKVAFFVRDNQGFMCALINDLLNEESTAIKFAQDNFSRHIMVLFKLISECQQDGVVESLPPPQIASFMMPAIIFPIVIASRLKVAQKFAKKFGKTREMASSDAAVLKRIDMALRGISI